MNRLNHLQKKVCIIRNTFESVVQKFVQKSLVELVPVFSRLAKILFVHGEIILLGRHNSEVLCRKGERK